MSTLEAAAAEATLAPTVQLTRLIRIPRASVYEAWTNPAMMKQWFGPATMHCTTAVLDARPGGEYAIGVVQNDAVAGQPEAVASGNYTKVIPGKLLQFTWKPSWNPAEHSLVTVSFEDVDGGTQITIRHENIAEEAREGYTKGWAGCLDKMETVVAAPPQA